MTQQDRILAHVEAHPGCTAAEVQKALGGSAGAQVATLAARGLVRRARASETSPYRYGVTA